MPSSAPRPTAASRAVGVARPSAHGHATTRTATAALQADAAGSPAPSQKPSVATATAITHGTNTAAIRSASRCALALVACAWLTRRVICASRVSAPTWVARTTSRPLMFTVAPVTGSPGPTSAGIDSPVTSDASTAERPSVTIPSVAIFSPGRTTNRSPAGEFRHRHPPLGSPSRSTATVLAPRAASALSARPDRSRARASRYRPASTAAVTPAAASRYSVSPLAWPKVNANDIFIPVMPAPPNSSAYTDQQNDAPTPDADQGVHGGGAVAQAVPGGPVQRPGAPGRDRRGQQQAHPLPAGELRGRHHRQHDDRHGQRDADHEPPGQRPGLAGLAAGRPGAAARARSAV